MTKHEIYILKRKIQKKIKKLNILTLSIVSASALLTILSLNTAMPYYVLKIIAPLLATSSVIPLSLSVINIKKESDCNKKIDYINKQEDLKEKEDNRHEENIDNHKVEKSNNNHKIEQKEKIKYDFDYRDYEEILNEYYGKNKSK